MGLRRRHKSNALSRQEQRQLARMVASLDMGGEASAVLLYEAKWKGRT
jgi:hypothetical protein